jgi:DNA-binding transcriptional regulator YdaS (Cro superfamily)
MNKSQRRAAEAAFIRVQELIREIHGQSPFVFISNQLKISDAAVHQWKVVPPRRVQAVRAMIKNRMTAAEMRPDVFGEVSA